MRPRTWVITLLIFSTFTLTLPNNWLLFIPIIVVWFGVSAGIASFLSVLIAEMWDDN